MCDRLKYFFLIVLLLVLFGILFLFIDDVNAASVSLPTILEVKQEGALNFLSPLVVGLTEKETDVLVYIDEEFIDFAEINESETDTNNFYFRISKSPDIGKHTLVVQARNKKTLILSPLTSGYFFYIRSLPAPTLVSPRGIIKTNDPRPAIHGLTISGTKVQVYIDGELNGETAIVFHKSGTASFSYKPLLDLSLGEHTVSLRAEDENGDVSQKSLSVKFYIENPLPAPVLREKYSIGQDNILTIAGNVKNNLSVKIFVDHDLKDKFPIENDESGTANFSYTTPKALTNGPHVVYTTSIDKNGKESKWSNILWLNIATTTPVKPRITEVAAEEIALDEEKNIGEKSEIAIIDPEKITKADVDIIDDLSKDIFDVPEDEDVIKEISEKDAKKILEIPKSEKKEIKEENEEPGLINEDNEKQSRLSWNVFIFFLFLLAVIAWIFWVNRELIKEKQEKKEESEENKEERDKFQDNLKI